MTLSSCGKHNIIASKRCAVCHVPLCVHCKTFDQCCSKKCFGSRQKFAFKTLRGPKGERGAGVEALIKLFKLGVLTAVAYAIARYLGYL